ncbi:MAG: hypothetical protein ABW048_08845 [Sphingobium sp.]
MDDVEQNLANWKAGLFPKIPVGGLFARSPVAHKWKATFRSLMLREAAFWREQDLMAQSYALYQQGHVLGARILLRSGYETLATMIYINLLMANVLDGKLGFHDFGDKTAALLLGTRNNEDMPAAINILTVLGKCDKRYPGIMDIYADLSESAHPNYEGLCAGYSKVDHDEYETVFSNRWLELHGEKHLDGMRLCMGTFHHEYDAVWPELFEALEKWIEANDAELEATKQQPEEPEA